MNVHLIGAGKMGLPMGRHLVAGGHGVTVDDLHEDRLAVAAAVGMAVAQGPAGLGAAEVVLSSLPNDDALWHVAQEVGRHARPGTVYIDTSTVSPAMSGRVAGLLQARQIPYLRATVSGNNMMADAAQLTLLVSGPRDVYERMLPLLGLFGPSQYWLGEEEQSRLMKLVVNLMIAQTSAMLAESLTLGTKGGLRWEDMWEVLTHSAVASPIVKAKSAQLVLRDFTPTFTVAQMAKDVRLILGEAERLAVSLPQTALTLQLLHAAAANGDADADYAAVIRCAERAAGLA
ncbi:NAD(P)-dependent oxidoreductase [Verticiella sediminum]|uniref:NAD(P)-dependent oxidoreductase n=1 Tax=Verticiella sediminum TaxID=1247510 RepID=A0A556AEA2_9BURK|nr:NAD(P)-dependent oxidoreductase [Verticiella sediminum]TSH91221.1 NAD(P)-dependent oxidoreductase [Verticiella sediminum]